MSDTVTITLDRLIEVIKAALPPIHDTGGGPIDRYETADHIARKVRAALDQPQPTSVDRGKLEGQAKVYVEACEKVINGSTGTYDWKEKHEAEGERQAYNRMLATLSEGGDDA